MTGLDTQASGPNRAREAQHPFAARNVLRRPAYWAQMDLLGQMKVFVRIVESRSLTAAARQLRVSAATVSRQLLALEQTLGAPLILRTTRGSTVTDAGRQYYERCLRVVREIDDAQQSVRTNKTVQGVLTVSAPVTLGLVRVCPHVPALLSRHPGLRIDLRLEDRVVDIVSDGVDIAIRSGIDPPDSNSLIAQPLMTYGRILVASPAYLDWRGEPETPEALAIHDLLVHLGAPGIPPGWQLFGEGREVKVEGLTSFRTNALLALKDAVLSGAGIALLADWLVRDEIERGALHRLLPAWNAPPARVFLLHRVELRGALRVRVFIDHLRAVLAGG